MTPPRQNPDLGVVIRPNRATFFQALLSTNVFLIPVAIVLYALTIPDGPWLVVLVVQVLASVLFAIASAKFFMVGLWVRPDGISEQGYFGPLRHVEVEHIESILLVRTYHGGGTDTVPQLFLCDDDNNQLVRMRGQYWTRESMQLVADTLDIEITEHADDVSRRELHQEFPGLLYWFERRPVLAAAIFSTSVVVTGVLVYLLLALLDLVE